MESEGVRRRQDEQTDVLREIRNEINTPELRDRMAMAAMQGLFSASFDEFWVQKPDQMNLTTAHAYEWADAMLKARASHTEETHEPAK